MSSKVDKRPKSTNIIGFRPYQDQKDMIDKLWNEERKEKETFSSWFIERFINPILNTIKK